MQNDRWLVGLVGLIGAVGCSNVTSDPAEVLGDDDEVAQIAAAIEHENGGFDDSDDEPAFGSATIEDLDATGEDALPSAEEAAGMNDGAEEPTQGAASRPVLLLWGQIPGNPAHADVHDWSGALRVNRGAIRVEHLVRFERPTDRVLVRTDPASLEFVSYTVPHHDGLVLRVIDPTPSSEEPLVLSYVSRRGDVTVAIELASLGERPQEVLSFENGDRMIALTLDRNDCREGFTMGRWWTLDDGSRGYGRFLGRVVDDRGVLRGHIKGLFGMKNAGDRVFFGKIIDLLGRTRALVGGTYGDGEFEGELHTRAGRIGEIAGRYAAGADASSTSGLFIGRLHVDVCDNPTSGE